MELPVSSHQLCGEEGSSEGGGYHTPCSRTNHYIPLRAVKKHLLSQCSHLPKAGFFKPVLYVKVEIVAPPEIISVVF